MNSIKATLFFNWHFMRVLRLALGIFIAFQAIKMHDAFSGVIAAFFLFQAITNTGCCGSQGCSTSVQKNNSDKIEDIEFEEIKSDKN
jgi:hypothetical protein